MSTDTSIRPSVLSLNISSKSALYASYMSFVKNGGLFIPTTRQYALGDQVYMLLQIMNEPNKYPVAGQVMWITPEHAQGGKAQGVGVQLSDDEAGQTVKVLIERILGPHLASIRPTHTI